MITIRRQYKRSVYGDLLRFYHSYFLSKHLLIQHVDCIFQGGRHFEFTPEVVNLKDVPKLKTEQFAVDFITVSCSAVPRSLVNIKFQERNCLSCK